MHLFLDWWEFLTVTIRKVEGTYIENLVIRAYGIVAATIIAINQHLQVGQFLVSQHLLFLIKLLLFWLQKFISISTLSGTGQLVSQTLSTANFDITCVVRVSTAVGTQVISEIGADGSGKSCGTSGELGDLLVVEVTELLKIGMAKELRGRPAFIFVVNEHFCDDVLPIS